MAAAALLGTIISVGDLYFNEATMLPLVFFFFF